MNVHTTPRPGWKANPMLSFFTIRWHGYRPLTQLFWVDMLVVGTAVNVATTLVAVLMLGFKASTILALAVHFSPLPYNLFLVWAVWRTADKVTPRTAPATKAAALVWLAVVTLI